MAIRYSEIVKLNIVLCFALYLTSTRALCAAAMEGKATAIKKTYPGGSSIEMSCERALKPKCRVLTTSGKLKSLVPVNFGVFDLSPTMEKIGLIGDLDQEKYYSFRVEVFCLEIMKYYTSVEMNDKNTYECSAVFHIERGALKSVQVRAFPSNIEKVIYQAK